MSTQPTSTNRDSVVDEMPSITQLAVDLALREQGRQACVLGQHAYTPWTPPIDDTGIQMCWCARGCGYYVRSDELL